MNKKRFELAYERIQEINKNGEIIDILTDDEVVDLLNKQEDIIITLQTRLEKINNGYGYLTRRKGLTANEWVIQSQEKELKKKDDRISEWIEQHSNDIAKINEQNKLIQTLREENEQLRQFINKGKRLSVKELIDNANENELLKKKIKGLEKENDNCKNDYRELFSNYVTLEEENDILKQKLKTKCIINKQYEEKERLKKENEQLQQELQGMNELLKSYRKTIKHDAELLADATRNGYLPPLDDIKR